MGLPGIVVEPTEDLLRLQDELIKAVEPYNAKTGTPTAFFSDEGGRDIQQFLISYIDNFVKAAAGERFNPYVTIGVGLETYLKEMLAEPFPSFTFSPVGASVYQLGAFGTARKELKALRPRLEKVEVIPSPNNFSNDTLTRSTSCWLIAAVCRLRPRLNK
jgi:hypothetical protein